MFWDPSASVAKGQNKLFFVLCVCVCVCAYSYYWNLLFVLKPYHSFKRLLTLAAVCCASSEIKVMQILSQLKKIHSKVTLKTKIY